MPDALSDAMVLAEAVRTAKRHRPFVKAVHEFSGFLRHVPNSSPGSWSHESIKQLGDIADRVVEAIELQISASDSTEDQRDLAARIYSLRRSLEEINTWERHFLG